MACFLAEVCSSTMVTTPHTHHWARLLYTAGYGDPTKWCPPPSYIACETQFVQSDQKYMKLGLGAFTYLSA